MRAHKRTEISNQRDQNLTRDATSYDKGTYIMSVHYRIEISNPRDRNLTRDEVWHVPDSIPTQGCNFSILQGQAHDGVFLSHFSKLYHSINQEISSSILN